MAAAVFSSMKVSQLRALCLQSGIDTTGMLEKQEFVKALEAKSPPANDSSSSTTTANNNNTAAAPDGDEQTRVDFHEMKISTLRNLCTSMGVSTTGMFEKREFVEALQRKTGTVAQIVPPPSSEPEPSNDSETTTNQNVTAAKDPKEYNRQSEIYVETVEESSSNDFLSDSERSFIEEIMFPAPRTRKRGQSPVSIAQSEALDPSTRDCRRRAVCPSSSKMSRDAAKDPPSPSPDSQSHPCSDTSEISIGSGPAERSPSLSSQACPRPRSISPKPKPKHRSTISNPSPLTSDGCETPSGSNLPKRSGSSPSLTTEGYPAKHKTTPQNRPGPNSFSPKPQRRSAGRNPFLPNTSDSQSPPPLSKSLHSKSRNADEIYRPKTPVRSKSAGSISPAVKVSTIEKIRRQQERRAKQSKEDAILRAKHTKRRGKEMMDEPIYHDSAGMYDNSPQKESRRLRNRRTRSSDNYDDLNESNGRLQSRRAAISSDNDESRRLQSRRSAISNNDALNESRRLRRTASSA